MGNVAHRDSLSPPPDTSRSYGQLPAGPASVPLVAGAVGDWKDVHLVGYYGAMAENRREFIQRGLLSISAIPTISSTCLKQPPNLKAQDVVSLGESGIDVSRLGFGLGVTFGKIYREMGQTAFSRLIHRAYDQGIRYFDLAGDIYVGMHLMLGEALKGVRRDSYYLITQTGRQIEETIPDLLTRYQKELRTDYFDAVLRTSVSASISSSSIHWCP